jgi:HEAT repeat protein
MSTFNSLQIHVYHLLKLLLPSLFFLSSCSNLMAARADKSQTNTKINKQNLTVNTVKPKPQAWEIKGILAALEDSDANVRGIAFSHVTGYDWRGVQGRNIIAKKAIARLKDRRINEGQGTNPRIAMDLDEEERWDAARALAYLDDAAAPYAKDLGNLLRNPEAGINAGVAEALGNVGDAAAPYATDLLKLAKNEQIGDMPRYAAIEALGKLDSPATPYAKDLLSIAKNRSLSASVRDKAIEALEKTASVANYAGDLKDILQERSNYYLPTCSAARALGRLGNAATPYVTDLENVFKDKSLELSTRQCAVEALGNLGATPSAKDLLAILKNKSIALDEQRQAATLLTYLGNTTQPYSQDLIAILKDQRTDAEVRLHVAYALKQIGDAIQPYRKDLLAIAQDKQSDPKVQYQTLLALGKSDGTVKALIALIKAPDTNPFARNAAAAVLDEFGDAVTPYAKDIVLIAKTQGDKQEIRDVNFARHLGGYGLKNLNESARPYAGDLLKIVRDRRFRFEVRRGAAQALINLSDRAKPYNPDIIEVMVEAIKRSPGDMSPLYVTHNLSLDKLAPLSAQDLRPIVQMLSGSRRELGFAYSRFLAYFYSGGDKAAIALLK